MQDAIIPIVEHVCDVKKRAPFTYSVSDCIEFHDNEGDYITGFIYKVDIAPDDTATYHYCDVYHVGVCGTVSSREWMRPPPRGILYKLEKWWYMNDADSPEAYPDSITYRPTLAHHYRCGELIGLLIKDDTDYRAVTGMIYKVVYLSDEDAKYSYCDVRCPGKYGTATTLEIVVKPEQIKQFDFRRWWDEPEYNTRYRLVCGLEPYSPRTPLGSPPPPNKVGDIVRIRVEHQTAEDWDFTTGLIYKVDVRPSGSIKYSYYNIFQPGVCGESYQIAFMGPAPVELDMTKIRCWWTEPKFSPPFVLEKQCPPSPEFSPRPSYSPIDWETDPIYLAAKAKKTPAFKDFDPKSKTAPDFQVSGVVLRGRTPAFSAGGPEMLSDEPKSQAQPKTKKSKKNKRVAAGSNSSQAQPKKKSKPYDEYYGWSPDGGCSHLRWGDPAPHMCRRSASPADECARPSKATTVEELECTEDFAECVRD